jgi:hypothetical protein
LIGDVQNLQYAKDAKDAKNAKGAKGAKELFCDGEPSLQNESVRTEPAVGFTFYRGFLGALGVLGVLAFQ